MSLNCVYIIENLKTCKFYVGSTNNPKRRKHQHYSALRNGKHYIKELQDDFMSEDDLHMHYVVVETREEASELELLINEELIDTGVLYNKNRTGQSGTYTLPLERRREVAKSISDGIIRLNKAKGPERLFAEHSQPGEKNGMYGRTHTAEARERISRLNKGKSAPNKGVPMSSKRHAKLLASIAERDYQGKNNPFYGKKTYARNQGQNETEQGNQLLSVEYASSIGQWCCLRFFKTGGKSPLYNPRCCALSPQ